MLVNFVYGGKLGIRTITVAIRAKNKDNLMIVFINLFITLNMNPIVKVDS